MNILNLLSPKVVEIDRKYAKKEAELQVRTASRMRELEESHKRFMTSHTARMREINAQIREARRDRAESIKRYAEHCKKLSALDKVSKDAFAAFHKNPSDENFEKMMAASKALIEQIG